MLSVPIYAQQLNRSPESPSGYAPGRSAANQKRTLVASAAEIPARPFVKWAGGKRQLLPELLARLPNRFHRYHEPFVGGGALFFALAERGQLANKPVRLADINVDLVNTYQVVRDSVETLIHMLGQCRNEETFFYEMRAQDPNLLDPIQRAARLLYLNKTCFNGLFRENRQGRFNVPFGHYADPSFLRPNDLRAASHALRGVTIERSSFAELESLAQPGDFIYFDPPYAPVSRTASFTSYSAGGFDEAAQQQLADLVTRLGESGVHILLSNSAVPLTESLYRQLHVEQVLASRAINSRGDRRGKVAELLVAAGPLAAELRRRPAATLLPAELAAAAALPAPARSRRPSQVAAAS